MNRHNLTKLLVCIALCATLLGGVFTSAAAANIESKLENSTIDILSYDSGSIQLASAISSDAKNVELAKKEIIQGIENFESSINILKYNIYKTDLAQIYYDIVYSNPCLYQVFTSIAFNSISGSEYVYAVKPKYILSEDEYVKSRVDFDKVVNEMLSHIDSKMTKLQKALILHDELAKLAQYDEDYYLGNEISVMSYTSYGALVNKNAVCQGYSLAYMHLLDECGIESYAVISDSMNHMWNMVKTDEGYYHVDVTWDDSRTSIDGNLYDVSGKVMHDYFMLNDQEMQNANHFDWACDYTSTGKAYEKSFIKNLCESGSYAYNSKIYSLIPESSSKVNVVETDIVTGAQKSVYTIDNQSYVINQKSYTWSAANARLDGKDNYIYVTECRKIKAIDLNTLKVAKTYDLNITNGTAYGIKIVGDEVRYDNWMFPQGLDQLLLAGETLKSSLITTEPITEPTTEPTTDTSTEPSTEPITEPTTEPTTDTSTEPSTEPITEPIMQYVIGDANSDNVINAKDVLLIRKYLAKYQNLVINLQAADCNEDGKVDAKDVLLLKKYLAKWNVTLGKAK